LELCAGLDVSVAETSVCVVDADGEVIRETKVPTEPEAIIAALAATGPGLQADALPARAGGGERRNDGLRLGRHLRLADHLAVGVDRAHARLGDRDVRTRVQLQGRSPLRVARPPPGLLVHRPEVPAASPARGSAVNPDTPSRDQRRSCPRTEGLSGPQWFLATLAIGASRCSRATERLARQGRFAPGFRRAAGTACRR